MYMQLFTYDLLTKKKTFSFYLFGFFSMQHDVNNAAIIIQMPNIDNEF